MAEKENDLVATGILPVIPNRQAGSLSDQSISGVGCHWRLAQFRDSRDFLSPLTTEHESAAPESGATDVFCPAGLIRA